jgi:hypothetical protein
MTAVLVILLAGAIVWLGVLTAVVVNQSRELEILLVSLKHIAGAEKHVGGTGRNRRRTDFRVPVTLDGFLRVLKHARPCRIVDLSRSGAQVLPEGGDFPIGEVGLLTVEFGEFERATTHARVVRSIGASGTYGIEFVDQPTGFRDKCTATVRRAFRDELGQN